MIGKPRPPETSFRLRGFALSPGIKYNLLLLIDQSPIALRRYWPLPEADDYRPIVDRWQPQWRSFAVYEGCVDHSHNPPLFVGRPLCGSVKG